MKNYKDNLSKNEVAEPMLAYSVQPNLFVTVFGNAAKHFNTLGASSFDMLTLSRQGLPKSGLMALAKKISLTLQEFATIMHISERTLQRYDDNAIIKVEYAEKAVELARLYTRGEEVFGSLDKFK